MHGLANWLYQYTGTKGFGPWYGFWSGFGGLLERLTELAVLGLLILHRTSCHNRRCWRHGRHETPAGYKLCRKCVARPLAELDLHEVHEDHR